MVEVASVLQDNPDEPGLSGKLEGTTVGVVTDYQFDNLGNVIGIARQEQRFCRIMASPPDGIMTISAPERGFAISVLFEDIVNLINQA